MPRILFPIGLEDFGHHDWQLDARHLQLLLRYSDVELRVVDQDISILVEFYLETGFVLRRCVHFDDTLIHVFLYIYRQCVCFRIAFLKFVVLYWLFALHVTLGRLVAYFELGNPDLLFARGVAVLLSEGVYGILHIVVHGRQL